jgi:acid phosphatase type 7
MRKFLFSGTICVIAAFLPLHAGSPTGSAGAPKTAKPDPSKISTSSDPVLVGAGDIASCDDLSGAKATAELLEHIPGTIFANGDLAYPAGTDQQFHDCYGPNWGRFKERTRPAPGNHEYLSSGASGYSRYWGTAAGDPDKDYYSYDLGTWHIIALNSECAAVGGCDPESPQGQWLRRDLAEHPAACTLAYFHKPLFSSGKEHGYDPQMKPLWQMLYAGGADIIIGGHDHHYERFAPQDPEGNPDPQRGIREFVAGTGGKNSHRSLGPVVANSEVRNADTYGVLKLTLHASSYDWEFVPQAGKSFRDAGSDTCR